MGEFGPIAHNSHVSNKWLTSQWSSRLEGFEISGFVYEITFWSIIEEIIKAIESLVVVLWIGDIFLGF